MSTLSQKDLDQLPLTELDCLKKLVQLGTLIKETSDNQTLLNLRDEGVAVLQTLFKTRYDFMIRLHVAEATFSVHKYKDDVEFLEMFMSHFHKVHPLKSDFVKWCMSKMLAAQMARIVNERAGDLLQASILTLSKFLSDEEHKILLIDLVDQLYSVLKGSDQLCFLPNDRVNPYCLNIPISVLCGSDVTAYKTLIYLLIHGSFSFEILSPHHLLKFWQILLKVYSIHNIELRTLCVLIFQKLISLDLGNWVVCRLLMDKMLQIEIQISDDVSLSTYSTGLQEAHHSFFSVFADKIIRFDNTKTFKGIDLESLILWGKRSVEIAIKYPSPPPRLTKLVRVYCTILSRLKQKEFCRNEHLKDMIRDIQKLISTVLSLEDGQAMIDQLVPYMSFLIMVDKLTETKLYSNWLCGITVKKTSTLMRADKPVESIRVRRVVMAALTRCRIPLATEILPKILPDQNYLVQVLDKACENGSPELVRSLLEMIGDVVTENVFSPALTVAFLSVPWLTDPELILAAKRHFLSIPLLKEFVRTAKKGQQILSDQLRECSLGPLAHVKGFSEWRRVIFLSALQSKKRNLVQIALSNIATFIALSESASFNILVSATLDLVFSSNTPVELSRILSALSACVCASHPDATIPFDSVECKHCLSLRSGTGDAVQCGSKNPLLIPDRLMIFLESILKADNIASYDRHTRLEAAILLSSCMCHSAGIDAFNINVLENSLNLMTDCDEDLQWEYLLPLKLIVSSKQSDAILNSIKSHLLAYEKIEDETKISLVANHMCQFLVLCAKEAFHQDIRSLAFKHHFSMVLQFGTRELFASMRTLIRDLALASKIDTIQLFERKVQVLSEDIASDLISSVQRLHLAGNNRKESAIAVIDDVLFTTQKIFGFEGIGCLITSCGKFLIPALFLVDEQLQSLSCIVLDRIRDHIHATEAELGTEFFPSLLSFRLFKKIDDDDRSLLFVRHYCGIETGMLVNQRRYFCNLFLIHMLSVDQEKCLELIYDINMDIVPAPLTLTKVIKVNCEYLGLLLHFRRTLFDDVFYEQRPILLASFAAFIRLLDSTFISQIVNKLMVFLRAATTVGEGAIPSWVAFVQRLETRELESLLPQILIAIQPLMRYEAAGDLLELIFEQKGPLEVDQCENFKRTALVLINRDSAGSSIVEKYLRRVSVTDVCDRVVKECVRMLIDECETVGKVVLEKLISTLDGNSLDDVLAAQLVPALFHCLRRCSEPNVRLLAAKCLGRIGAVDPGRLGLSLTNRRLTSDALIFAGDKDFSADLIERCWKVYSTVTNAFMIDQIEYSIQELLAKLVGQNDEEGIMNKLSAECRRDIEPLRRTHLNPNRETKLIEELPIVDHVGGFDEWLQQCYLLGSAHVRGSPMREVFRALKWIVNTKTTIFTKHLLCQLIIRLLVENPVDNIIDNYSMEMEKVLESVMSDSAPSWIRMAAHVVFSILDVVERYIILKLNGPRRTSHKEVDRAREFVNRIVRVTMPDGSLLVVAAAERCQCLFRALRWCEQFGIKKDANGGDIFCRNHFYTMERIYSQLQNVDGVLGAFECLANRVDPSADERILALEAKGDYSEALPLYANSEENQQMKLIRCLLRLNQPNLALDTATSFCSTHALDEMTKTSLEACQIEATWHLRDWEMLGKMIEKSENILSLPEVSWGATCASIMCSVKKRQPAIFSARLEFARERLVENLTAMTIEHLDAYAQAYKYVVQLHILEEVDDATASLNLLSTDEENREISLQSIIKKWKSRSESTMQCTSTLEPILQVRREILETSRGNQYKREIAQLLIESSRLARQAGHLQIAWTHLVEAKKLDVSYKDVGMEEARFEFQKGNQQQAIGILSKLLKGKFENMNNLFDGFIIEISNGQTVSNHAILRWKREERAAFAEVQLLRAEYMMKAGAMSANDLYKTYNALRSLDVPSEDLFYRVAVFMDSMFGTDGKGKTDLMILLLDTYCSTLKYGKSHLFHALPRMLTLWLDLTQKKSQEMQRRKTENMFNSEMEARDRADIERMNAFIIEAFHQLASSDFYTAFPQLISRIVHPDESVFNTLKIILSELICKYPHQCLWQSVAVYRTGTWSKNMRQQRCTEVYNVARNRSKRSVSGRNEMEDLIDQYDYISSLLIKFADEKCQPGTYTDMSTKFAALYEFFKYGKMDCSYLMGARERRLDGIRKVKPSIMIPLTEMLQHAVTPERDLKVCYMSQMVMLPDSLLEEDTNVPEVLVRSLDQEYIVLKSMQRPKKLTLRAADGRTLPLMCKPGDELRKDARFMDVSRMMNSLMKQNADARRRQLMVRTFSVIPLQSGGGILEWLNNLMPYRGVLQPLFEEKSGEPISDGAWFKNWDANAREEEKVKKMRTYFYENYPLVMAEWFRRQFADPASWHAARTSYASSSAVMSMIGFVLGLGDRHGENVLMDVLEGCVVHVDFNLIFNKGEQLPVKEIVPFRLTRNMVNGLGPTGVEGVFRKACEVTMRVLRENKETLLSVIQTFVHDPLVEWISTEARAQQNRRGNVGGQQQAPKAINQAQEAVSLIAKRLEGHIVTPEIYKLRYNCPPMSLEGQVDKLISLATDENLLSQMYIGWAPFM